MVEIFSTHEQEEEGGGSEIMLKNRAQSSPFIIFQELGFPNQKTLICFSATLRYNATHVAL